MNSINSTYRVTYARLGGEVDYRVEAAVANARIGTRTRNVELLEAKTRVRLQPSQAGVLERGIVVVVEVADAVDIMVAGKECFGDVHPYEAGFAGETDIHLMDTADTTLLSKRQRPVAT